MDDGGVGWEHQHGFRVDFRGTSLIEETPTPLGPP